MTLRRYAEKFKIEGEGTTHLPNFASNQIFSTKQEVLLAIYLLTASKMNYGLTTRESRELALSFAVENRIKLRKNKRVASKDWLRGFVRHSDLSIRVTEATSLARSTAFNKHTVGEFYNLLRTVLEREKFTPEAIYNYDETGVQTSHKPGTIITKKGQKNMWGKLHLRNEYHCNCVLRYKCRGSFHIPLFLFSQGRKYRNMCCLVHHLVLWV